MSKLLAALVAAAAGGLLFAAATQPVTPVSKKTGQSVSKRGTSKASTGKASTGKASTGKTNTGRTLTPATAQHKPSVVQSKKPPVTHAAAGKSVPAKHLATGKPVPKIAQKRPTTPVYHSYRSGQQAPTPARYQEIQQALADKGYYHGETNGAWGPESTDALKRFQRDQKLTGEGKLDSLSLIALGLGPKRTLSAQASKPSVESLPTKPPVQTSDPSIQEKPKERQ